MKLPTDFLDKMKKLLNPNEFEAFLNTYRLEKTNGLRVNPLKITKEQLKKLYPSQLEDVPFCPIGCYYETESTPGKHPFHLAGLYYIQEPSAMFVAEVLSPEPTDKVLDLCAAPGGKSTHLATLMNNQGFLLSNEIHPKRVKALSENIERLGITNTLVTNETPEKLAKRFPHYFDKILVDAPCSGEGMFRKDPEACSYWSLEHVANCAHEQKHILDCAYEMLGDGGILVYSTCTFSPEENEQIIDWFLMKYEDMTLLEIPKIAGIQDARVEWSLHKNHDHLTYAKRLWPHLVKGEGHFVAKLKKRTTNNKGMQKTVKSNVSKAQLKDYVEFEKMYLNKAMSGIYYTFKNQLFLLPTDTPDLSGLKVIRAGLHLGEFKKNRFEPNHAFALALKQEHAKYTFSLDETNWLKYVKGETLLSEGDRGWVLMTIEGYPIGWGKEVKGIIKNFYPKGLRIM